MSWGLGNYRRHRLALGAYVQMWSRQHILGRKITLNTLVKVQYTESGNGLGWKKPYRSFSSKPSAKTYSQWLVNLFRQVKTPKTPKSWGWELGNQAAISFLATSHPATRVHCRAPCRAVHWSHWNKPWEWVMDTLQWRRSGPPVICRAANKESCIAECPISQKHAGYFLKVLWLPMFCLHLLNYCQHWLLFSAS